MLLVLQVILLLCRCRFVSLVGKICCTTCGIACSIGSLPMAAGSCSWHGVVASFGVRYFVLMLVSHIRMLRCDKVRIKHGVCFSCVDVHGLSRLFR